MKTRSSSRKSRYLKGGGILLLVAALIAGMVGCPANGVQEYSLTISSSEGGVVTAPGEDTFTHEEGAVVSLKAEAEEGYRFVKWSGDVGSVADPQAAETTITMDGHYSITANFAVAALEIRTWHDLDAVRENLGGRYVLMNDLDSATAGYTELAGMTANGGKGWEPIGTGVFDELDPEEPYTRLDPFTGTFDGQGYEIGDLFINRPDEYAVGLFGVVDEGGVIKDVGVVNVAVTGGSGVGGLVGGNLYGSTVNNAYVTGSVMGVMGVGGLVGGNGYGGIVSNSYSTASVTGDEGVGGLAGFNAYDAVVNSAFASGIVTGDWAVGGLVGVNEEGNVRDSYSRGHVSGIGNVGGLAGWNSGTVNRSYSSGTVIGEVDVGGLIGQTHQGTVDSSFWDVGTSGMEASDGGKGKTTAELRDIATFTDTATEGIDDPWDIIAVAYGETDSARVWNIVAGRTYPFLSWQEPVELLEIRSWHDLDAIRDDLAGHYVLMNDLDSTAPGYEELASAIANGGKGWEPIGVYDQPDSSRGFTGYFNGKGYEIGDMFIDRPDEDGVGLFGFVDEGGFIQGVGVIDAHVTGRRRVGGLAGFNRLGTVDDCYSSAVVAGEELIGGLLGWNRGGTVKNSHSTGSVTGDGVIGGLVGGSQWGTVRNSHYDYDEVLINGEKMITIGALYGEDFNRWLTNNRFLDVNERLSQDDGYYSIYDVADFKHLLAFGQDGSLRFRLHNDLDLGNDPNFFIPYLAGEFDGNGHKISNLNFNCDAIAMVGVFGYLASGGIITQTGAESPEIRGGPVVGGLVGWNDGMVSDSYAIGSVTGEQEVGGLVGTNCGTVSRSYSSGSVAGGWEIGGLVGYNYRATISNSYSTSSVAGDDRFIGGLVGVNNEGTVSNCYSVGNVSGGRRVGGLAGYSDATVSNSFWDAETSGMDESAGGTGKTTAEMRDIATFANTTTEGLDEPWDIAAVSPGEINPVYTWNIVDGQTYPFLSWESIGQQIEN